jgi:hypothetical protein
MDIMAGDAGIPATVIRGLRAVLLPRLRLFLNEEPREAPSVPLDGVWDSELERSEDKRDIERWEEEEQSRC